MVSEGNIWYHGSPVKFDKFLIGMTGNSRLPHDDSLDFSRSPNLAKAFAKGGYLYTVELSEDESNLRFSIPDFHSICNLGEAVTDEKGIKCIRIFNERLARIIKIEKI